MTTPRETALEDQRRARLADLVGQVLALTVPDEDWPKVEEALDAVLRVNDR